MGRKKRGRLGDAHELRRPESDTFFYQDRVESQRYHACPQTQRIQRELTAECVHVLLLKQNAESVGRASGLRILNVGCGSGHCGAVIRENGMDWVGADVSRPMLNEADASCTGLLLEADCFGRLPFRSGSFDHGISVSAIQWICVSKSPDVTARLFFRELSRVIKTGGVFVAQLYPRHQQDVDCLHAAAADAGWAGMPYVYTGFPHESKAKKRFMCLKNDIGAPSAPSVLCPCPLSWPLRMPCGGADRDRLDREHAEFSAHSLRLLRRAAAGVVAMTGGSVEQEASYWAVDVTCADSCLAPCGGTFSLHVSDSHVGSRVEGRASDVLRELLGGNDVACASSTRPVNKTGVPVDWGVLLAYKEGEHALRNPNPHFNLREVQGSWGGPQGASRTRCFVLECPKRAPLVAVVCSLPHSRAFSELVMSRIQPLASTAAAVTVVGIDVNTDTHGGVAHAAVLMYVPCPATASKSNERTLDDTLCAMFPTKNFLLHL